MILLALKDRDDTYISGIAREINGTYAHTFNLIREMEGQGIISTAKKGRTKYVSLTDKGRVLAEILSDFVQVLEKGRGRLRKGVKRTASSGTATGRRLDAYQEKIENMYSEVAGKRLGSAQKAKYRRLCGRYKALVARLRPRNKVDKKRKTELLSRIEAINENLSR
ncbi:MAG: hypothetical protein GXP49_08695 [Deltaproteobacteria bacterium]|nr:hypothetical protein [Deltaproteobacteria bacterium]